MNSDKGWLVFAAIWLFVGMPFLAVGLWVGWDELPWLRLPDAAVLTRGEVLAKDRGQEGEFVVRYRFAATPANALSGTASVEEETWKRLVPNGPIRVMFLPDSPQVNLVEGHLREDRRVLAGTFTGLGGLLTILGATILVRWFTLQRADYSPPARRTVPEQPPRKPRKTQTRAPRTKAEKRGRRHQRTAAAASQAPGGGWRSTLKTIIGIALFLAALFLATVAVELSPQLQRIEAWTERHEMALLFATGGMCLLGIGLLLGSMLLRMMEAKRFSPEQREFPRAASAGAAILVLGAFGVTMCLLPMEFKLLLAALLVYVVVRTWRAIARG